MPRSRWGHIEYVSEGIYRVHWYENDKKKSKTIHGTLDDAEIALAAIRLKTYGHVEDQSWDHYWKTTVKPSFEGLEPKTTAEYERLWERELKPRIGNQYVGSTNWRYCQSILSDINSPSVQRATLRLWRKMCNMAVRDELLDRCPIDRTIKLKPHHKRKKHFLQSDDVIEWMQKIEGIKYEGIFLLEVGGGLSHEEACAMVKEKINEFKYRNRLYAIVTIDQALATVKGKKHLKGTKNDFRERKVVIGEPFANRILALSDGEGALCPGNLKVVKDGYTEKHFASPATITHNWRDWCKRHNVDYIRPGDMRSIYATWHGEAGSPDSLVSLSMGHSDGTTKGRNYQMSTKKGLILIADLLTDYIYEESDDEGLF